MRTVRWLPGLAFADADLGGDALPELGDVADDADHAAAFPQAVEHAHHLFEGVLVQAAEALVDEQRLDPGAARLGGDHVGQAEGEGQAGQERLAAGERAGVAVHAGPAVAGEQAEAGPARAAAGVGVHERVAAGGHLEQPLAGGGRDLLQAGGEHERRQGHPQRVRTQAGRQVGDPLGLGCLLGQRLQVRQPRGELGGEVGELFGLVLGAVVGGYRVVVGLAGRLDRRLRAGQVGGRVEWHVEVGVGEQFADGPGRGLVLPDGLVGRGPPGGVPPGVADRVQVGESGLGRGLDGVGLGPPGIFGGAGGGIGCVGGGDEHVGGLAGGAQRGVQVGLAAQLGQQRLAVPGGALAGLGRLAERGLALFAIARRGASRRR